MNARLRALPVPHEAEECKWLMQWAATQTWHGYKLDQLLIHVPNGAYHGADRKSGAVVARKLREQGLHAGVFDYILAVPNPGRSVPGLWLEMKRTRGGVVSDDQLLFMAVMSKLGWACEIARGWVEAKEKIEKYLREWQP